MRESSEAKIANSIGASANAIAATKHRVRSSPGGYLSLLFFLTFFSGFLNFLGFAQIGLILALTSWTTVPILWWFDRIQFDGKNLERRGFLAFLGRRFYSGSRRLKIAEIERVETHSLWSLKSGGRIFYRYSTEICGGELEFVFASGGKSYRQMVRALFPLIAEEKLDARSIELRDFLVEPEAVKFKAAELNLPSTDVLDNALPKSRREIRIKPHQIEETTENAEKKASELRRAANELRIAGNLAQALEAFRRALLSQPHNGWLLHEFARALHSYANAAKNETWARRSLAALHLAAQRSQNDSALLTKIGESFFQFGKGERAAKAFRKALELETDNFRAEIGLAEIGLQDGKIAHVVHHFQAAARAAEDAATSRWARAEAEYFSLLNSDVDYMETELTRIGWLGSVSRGKRICWRLTTSGLFIVLIGNFLGEDFAALGWSISAVTSTGWLLLLLTEKLLAGRAEPEDEIDED